MKNEFNLRPITESDAAAVLAIYAPYVRDTVITFDCEVPSAAEYLTKIRTIATAYPWLLCCCGETVAGFAYGGKHRHKAAYDWTAEATVYMAPAYIGKGLARPLYEAVFALLRLQGYHNVYAGITLPNENSLHFHKALGFEEVGVFKRAGYKFGSWHDTAWLQLFLTEAEATPGPLKTTAEVSALAAYRSILEKANARFSL